MKLLHDIFINMIILILIPSIIVVLFIFFIRRRNLPKPAAAPAIVSPKPENTRFEEPAAAPAIVSPKPENARLEEPAAEPATVSEKPENTRLEESATADNKGTSSKFSNWFGFKTASDADKIELLRFNFVLSENFKDSTLRRI
jgi:hypothetical protein